MKQPRFNLETEMAMAEARLLMEEKVPAKSYTSAKELLDEPDAEEAGTHSDLFGR